MLEIFYNNHKLKKCFTFYKENWEKIEKLRYSKNENKIH